MKMNKKGFTLIEMLVVIAIIAVLVSIVVPAVGSSTDKAAAATNAANLRSLKAEMTTLYMTGEASAHFDVDDTTGKVGEPARNSVEIRWGEFKGTSTPVQDDKGFTWTGTEGNYVVKYNGLTINDWAKLAD